MVPSKRLISCLHFCLTGDLKPSEGPGPYLLSPCCKGIQEVLDLKAIHGWLMPMSSKNEGRSWARDDNQVGTRQLPLLFLNPLVSQGSGVGRGIWVITSAKVNVLWGEGITQHSPPLLLQGAYACQPSTQRRSHNSPWRWKCLWTPNRSFVILFHSKAKVILVEV